MNFLDDTCFFNLLTLDKIKDRLTEVNAGQEFGIILMKSGSDSKYFNERHHHFSAQKGNTLLNELQIHPKFHGLNDERSHNKLRFVLSEHDEFHQERLSDLAEIPSRDLFFGQDFCGFLVKFKALVSPFGTSQKNSVVVNQKNSRVDFREIENVILNVGLEEEVDHFSFDVVFLHEL